MQAILQKIGNNIGLVLSQDEVTDLQLQEGDVVEISRMHTVRTTESVGTEEALKAFKQTEPAFASAYAELAK